VQSLGAAIRSPLLNHDDVKIIGNFDLLPHQPAGFMISHLVRAGALAIICANSTPSTASARNIYDGQWNVLIVTQMGSCDPASRYSLQIVNGNVVDGSGLLRTAVFTSLFLRGVAWPAGPAACLNG